MGTLTSPYHRFTKRSLPFVSFKVSLHNLLYQLKEPELIDDHGILSHLGNDDFQCKLSVNEEEVSNVADCFKEERGRCCFRGAI